MKEIVIGNMPDRLKSDYFRQTVLPHEIGHAIHNTNDIISNGVVSKEFGNYFKDLQNVIKGTEKELNDIILEKRFTVSENEAEQLCVIADILGSLTKGKFGFGHSVAYYKTLTKPEAEIFAHGISLMEVDNIFTNITPEMKTIIDKMIAYSKGL